jgi:hypothetical protein
MLAHDDVIEVRAATRDPSVVQGEDAVHLERVEGTTDDALSFRTSPPGHLPLVRRQGARKDEQETHDGAEVAGVHGPLEERVEPDNDDRRDHDEQWQPLPPFLPPSVPDPLVLTLRGLARHPSPRSPRTPCAVKQPRTWRASALPLHSGTTGRPPTAQGAC